MESIFEIQREKKTPHVVFDMNRGVLEIKGYSLPTNAIEFYAELIQYIDYYLKNPLNETTLHLNFEYINTSSLKVIFHILTKFEIAMDMGKNVSFNWYACSDDSDMIDVGKQLLNSLKIPTHIIEID